MWNKKSNKSVLSDLVNRKEFIPAFVAAFLLIFVIVVLIGVNAKKKLPESTGRDVASLNEELESMGFLIDYDYEFDENVSKGRVSRIEPASGTKLKPKSHVNIIISRGKPITISDYSKTNIDTVKGILAGQGLSFECTEEYSEEVKKDDVISTNPSTGVIVEEGSNISIVVSRGSEFRTVPDYHDKTIEEIEKECEEMELKYVINKDFSEEIESGMVFDCNYSIGDKVSIENDTVSFTASKGPGILMPEIVGKNIDSVKDTLDKMGLKYNITEQYNDEKKNTVIQSGVSAETLVDQDTLVKLTVSKGTEEQEFKDQCESPSYDDLIRNPTKYESTKIKIKATVSKVENETLLGFKYGETLWGKFQGKEIVITDDRELPEPAMRAGDTVTIYGYGNGNSTISVKQKEYQGSLVLGFSYNKTVDSYDIPDIKVLYVDF